MKKAKVTKEELEASGYTTLRDYLNAKRGLKRRDGRAPVMRDSEGETASGMPREARGVKKTPDEVMSDYVKENKDKLNAAGMKRGGVVNIKHGGKVHKKGCDGIAKKGKTKGRMC